jgi:hypothetical protein
MFASFLFILYDFLGLLFPCNFDRPPSSVDLGGDEVDGLDRLRIFLVEGEEHLFGNVDVNLKEKNEKNCGDRYKKWPRVAKGA